jgi:hypothetical protein
LSHTGSCSIVKTRTELTAAMTNEDLENIESWLSALESLIALLVAQLPAAAGARLAATLTTLESRNILTERSEPAKLLLRRSRA